ncbi:VOC family protein [Ramlibacter sp. AW1]|uniref:VOC family protein n=1 Tax=Ramlibacter aurantiacus TaxID=2801330 RepID=A0A936ZKX7_9BURK|nr:VOC family protein [Ramlibacter aurantiacus]MBL0419125.1 VOC family protein [Ramlibacter aurantiacus]
MSIVGLDEVTLTTEDLGVARRFLEDFGLALASESEHELVFVARDRTGLRIRRVGDPSLPPGPVEGPNIRQAVWGVGDAAALERIAAELGKDREVRVSGGLVSSVDDDGLAIAFRLTQRVPLTNELPAVNVPGLPPQRKVNQTLDFDAPIRPNTFSHLVMYTPDLARIERFYVERLGFRITDRFTGMGVFMRAEGNPDHHQLFFIQRPPGKGLNHIAFHVRDMNEVMLAGKRLHAKGWASSWGPGRHIYGANVFWYFKSPFGGNIEYDADMDVVDDDWKPRETAPGPDTAAIWSTSYPPSAGH